MVNFALVKIWVPLSAEDHGVPVLTPSHPLYDPELPHQFCKSSIEVDFKAILDAWMETRVPVSDVR